MTGKITWIHIQIQEPELIEALDQMAREDDSDRSKLIRRLIRQESERRRQLALPGIEGKPARRGQRVPA